ncbi:hypothetical protein [uncultured Clostridium sp.]|uniref:hypothetical protein n=1 Tax=uncultured Clostridium sp. TaxID=59620 RepID=UPI0025F0DF60|nr:hypothetical protein [uncultured Clostridium sp.]
MKKTISLIIGIVISTTFISCNSTQILEVNTKESNDSSKYKFTERNIENKDEDKIFIPVLYKEDILYGKMVLNNSEYQIPYYLNSDGYFKEIEEGNFTKEEIELIKNGFINKESGIYMVDSNKLSERKFYYMDIINKTNFELKDFEKTYSKIEVDLKNLTNFGFKLEGSENFYIEEYLSVEDSGIGEKKRYIILDIKNQIYYTLSNDEMNFVYFYYNKDEDSIMAIDSLGKIYKIKIKENKINYEIYKEINLEDMRIYNRFGYNISNFNDEILIINIENNSKENLDYYNILYNIKSDEIISLDKEKKIVMKLINTGFYIVSYKENQYIAEISENGNINLIYKLDNDGYKCIYSIGNDKGDNTFLTRIKFSEESIKNPNKPIENEEIKYSILEIKER